MMGQNWRPNFDPKIVSRELEIIKNDLHCNSVRIQGLDIDRLVTASEAALSQGLEVWFSPEMWDRSQADTREYLVKAALEAEELRRRYEGMVVFSLGSELTLFMQGIVEGRNVFERLSNPKVWEMFRSGGHNKPLNEFLEKANESVREIFHGGVTYFSVPLETVDWGAFDFLGVDLYRDSRIADQFGKIASSYLMHKKPVIIGEFGCCTYRGAEKLGGNGFNIAFGQMQDYLGPVLRLPPHVAEMLKIIPKLDGHYIRDEGLQAREIVDQLDVLNSAGVDGAFVFTFASPNSPYNDDPRFDSDLGSYSLVKSYLEEKSAEEMIQNMEKQTREIAGIDITPEQLAMFAREMRKHVGVHGTTYPEMPWEPKESFRAVAGYYSTH